MLVGYVVFGHDNDSYMLDEGVPPKELTCPSCGLLTDFDFFNPLLKVRKKTYDYSENYDIGFIVSLKFKEFCLRARYEGLIFKELERSIGFYKFEVSNTVLFDVVRTGTVLLKFCETCKSFGEIIGVEPPFLSGLRTYLPDGFYRSDYLFGSGNNKNPLVIIGPETFLKLKKERFKGLVFVAIHS